MSKKKRNRGEYMRGRRGTKYGIYNTVTKSYQFGICEDTPMLAEARLYQMIGDDARKWRFEPRALPPDGKAAQSVVLRYSRLEASMLFELLYAQMEELMSVNTKNRLSKEPLLDHEQTEYFHNVMKFCAEQVRALYKYYGNDEANEKEAEG